MHITKVRVEGFKSFLDTTELELHPGINVIVGRNGSGKSNLVEAIALIMQMRPLSAKQRQAFTHDGGDSRAGTAAVEITLDNTSQRIPNQSDSVVIRRILTTGKQDFVMLNGKKVSNTHLLEILSAAGFSSSNPTNIIRQGEIQKFSICTNDARLKAIRDLAGAYVFDEKRATCSRKLFLGQAALKEIGEIVKTIENDISTLKQDKKLLKEFLQLEKSKKALEVVAKKGAQLEVQTKLHQVEASIEEKRRFLQETRKPLSNMWEEMNECQNGLKAITESITGCTENTAALTKDLDQKYAEKERLKLRMTEVVKQMEANEEKLSANGREEHAIVKQIETANRNYEATQAQWSEFSSIYENLDLQLKLRQSDQKFLYTRQDRLGAFRNLQERNSWILNEIQRVEGNLKDKNDQDKDWRKDLEDTVVQRASAEEEIGRCLENESEILAEIRQIKKDILDKTSQSKDMSQERQEIAKECLEMRKEIQILEDSQLDLENKLKSNPGMRDCVQGMKSIGLAVARLIEEGQDHLNESFHGPVADCLEWDPDVSECVNVVLGKRAFVCVVSTARVATQILRKLKELKLPGIFEFLPLDKVRSYKEMDYPEAMDAVPLISKVQPRAPQFEIVRRFYFNLWILVRHLETAHAFKGTKFHCITVSGDQTNSKGVMTGGYFNARRNNLLLYSQFFEKRMKGDELHAEVMERENNLQELGLRHEQLLADIQKDKSKAERLREKGMTQRENRLQYQQRLDNLVQSLKHTELKLTEIKSDLAQLNNEKDNLEKERDADPGESISQECVELSRDITDLLRHHKEAFKNKMEVERSRNDLSEQMRFLETKLAKIQESDTAEEIAHLNLELGASKEDYVRVRNQIRKDEEELEKMTQVTNKKCEEKCVLDKSRDALQGALEKMEEERQNMVNALDRDLAKKRDLEERAKDTASYSEGTGASEEEVAKVAHYTAKQCFSKMKQIDKKLRKKFGKVNKRADDQLALLLEKREQLESQRLTSLDESEQLQDLLDTTAGRCREKVEFTMRQVGKYFEEIFKTLVPDGYACLNIEEKLVRRSGNGSIASSSIGESGASSVDGDEDRGIEKVPVGVAVHVRFNHEEVMTELCHLSGGQKTLVSAAFIFAMQMCDPLPFYILDEIDAALDSRGRKRISEWMASKKNVQFICTTFREEFLERADKFIGVRFGNTSSHAEEINKNDAQDFIEHDPNNNDT